MMESKPHSREIKVPEPRVRKRGRLRIGFIEQVAYDGTDDVVGEAGFTCARVVRRYHFGGYVDALGFGDVGAEDARHEACSACVV
jgi:hypothetical protein